MAGGQGFVDQVFETAHEPVSFAESDAHFGGELLREGELGDFHLCFDWLIRGATFGLSITTNKKAVKSLIC